MEENIPLSQCFEKMKVEEENTTTLKDALMNDMSQKIQGRCLREEQWNKNCSDAVKKAARDELEKQLRKCFSMPEKEEPIEVKPKLGPKPKRRNKKREVLLEAEEEGTENTAKVNKRVPFSNKRMTRGYIRDLRKIQNESDDSVEVIEVIEPQDALIQFDTARYRYDNPEISEMIG